MRVLVFAAGWMVVSLVGMLLFALGAALGAARARRERAAELDALRGAVDGLRADNTRLLAGMFEASPDA